jgi:glycosyltransferase involved in cell wall biosynthesis
MRILYLTALNIDARSGAVEHVQGIVDGLVDLGHRVSLVALGDAHCDDPADFLVSSGGSWIRKIRLLRAAAESAMSGDTPPDVVYVRSFPLDYPLALRRLTKRRIPFVIELNTMISEEYLTEGKKVRAAIYGTAERQSLGSSVGWLGVTNEILERAKRKVRVAPPSAVALNGFTPLVPGQEVGACEARSELGVRSDARILVMTSFGRPWHGVDRALAMLRHLPSTVELWLVGARNRVETEALLRSADPAVESRVRFWPWLSGRDLTLVLAAADLGLGPLALDRKEMTEAQPMKVRMYLGAGLPVLQNYVDPALDSAGPFVSSVNSIDPSQLAEAALPMLELPRTERDNAAIFASQNLTWETAAKRTAAFLEGVLANS